eukprot:TRINITY_DN10978_c0_g1_i1.p2 TRINITY_DN10978_c0_g1~~TRINITY_DN10978_c0_g1_i1.p2  ORF type:complete len:243 (+),score=81.21 TRINITY_DN10978_c0_g1_i1:168-896(+)
MDRARKAVDDLTAQLNKTRSARESQLATELINAREALNNLTQQAAIDANVKAFLADRNRELEQPDGLEHQLAALRSKIVTLEADCGSSRRGESEACERVRRVEELLRQKEDAINEIQEFGVNASVAKRLQEMRDALQSLHAERDEALEQLQSANLTKQQLAARLTALGDLPEPSPRGDTLLLEQQCEAHIHWHQIGSSDTSDTNLYMFAQLRFILIQVKLNKKKKKKKKKKILIDNRPLIQN